MCAACRHALSLVRKPPLMLRSSAQVGGAIQRGSGGGLAFWWTSEPATPGQVYGHTDKFHGVGIFFDTYELHAPSTEAGDASAPGAEPYIVAMVNDGKELGGSTLLDSAALASKQVAVCFSNYRNLGAVAKARIAWSHGVLNLWLDLERTGAFQKCLSTDLGDERMSFLPSTGYFGLSASTGGYGDAHVIYSMALSPLDAKEEIGATPHVPHVGEHELKPEHVVHAEPADHNTHMKIIPTQTHGEGVTGADATGATGAAAETNDIEPLPLHNPVHFPPSVSEDEHMGACACPWPGGLVLIPGVAHAAAAAAAAAACSLPVDAFGRMLARPHVDALRERSQLISCARGAVATGVCRALVPHDRDADRNEGDGATACRGDVDDACGAGTDERGPAQAARDCPEVRHRLRAPALCDSIESALAAASAATRHHS